MNFLEVKGDGYIPSYTRIDFTDALYDAFGFHTDYQIVSTSIMKKTFQGAFTHPTSKLHYKLYIEPNADSQGHETIIPVNEQVYHKTKKWLKL